jgi:hypothetical protein
MKYMIGFPIAWLVVYLMFAFIALSWSPADWSENYRIFCAVCGMVWGAMLSYRISQDCKWSY